MKLNELNATLQRNFVPFASRHQGQENYSHNDVQCLCVVVFTNEANYSFYPTNITSLACTE